MHYLLGIKQCLKKVRSLTEYSSSTALREQKGGPCVGACGNGAAESVGVLKVQLNLKSEQADIQIYKLNQRK